MKSELPQTPANSAVHSPIHADAARQPGHWLLASLGKKVLRPGGLELTRQLIQHLTIGATDDVVEFAPGLGGTARIALTESNEMWRRPRKFILLSTPPAAAL